MRYPLAQIAAACVLVVPLPLYAQQASPSSITDVRAEKPCPAFSTSVDEQPSAIDIRVADVTFSGALQMPLSEQAQIAASMKNQPNGNSVDDVVDWALVVAREGWQDRGYFAAQVSGDARTLTSNAVGQRIAISVHVDEGPLYSLGKITFKHNKAISDSTFLRRLFPIERGDVLSRSKIANGLDNLKKAYGKLGYINLTTVPTPTFDDQSRIVSWDIDLDEGKQFRISHVNVLGVGDARQREILSAFPVGQTYDEKMFREFLKQHSFEPDDPWLVDRHLDERSGAVAITVDARPCVSD